MVCVVLASCLAAGVALGAEGVRFEQLRIDWSEYQQSWTYPGKPFPGLGAPQRSMEYLGKTDWSLEDVCGVIRGPEGIDVFWAGNGLYVMKEKGKPRRVWQAEQVNTSLRRVVFDGKVVWVAVEEHARPARLLVVDPVSEQWGEVTAKDGLPAATRFELDPTKMRPPQVEVAPLGPGTACVVGSSGGFSWIGVATAKTTASGRPSATLQVFHRAREATAEQRRKGDAALARDPTVRFAIHYALPVVVPGPKGGRPRTYVFVHRWEWNTVAGSSRLPLVVDPDERRVTVSPTEFPAGIDVAAVNGASLYYLRANRTGIPEEDARARVDLWRATMPKLEHERVAAGISSPGVQECSIWFADDGRVYTFDSVVHVAERPEGPFELAEGSRVPPRGVLGVGYHPRVYQTWHYGTLIRTFDIDTYLLRLPAKRP